MLPLLRPRRRADSHEHDDALIPHGRQIDGTASSVAVIAAAAAVFGGGSGAAVVVLSSIKAVP